MRNSLLLELRSMDTAEGIEGCPAPQLDRLQAAVRSHEEAVDEFISRFRYVRAAVMELAEAVEEKCERVKEQ